MTLQEARQLQHGQILHYRHARNADGTPQRWRVNGAVKTWKRSPERVEVPLKHGLYAYGYLRDDNLADFDVAR